MRILILLICLSWLTSCKTKHLQIERKEEKHKEVRKSQKDSVSEQKTENKSFVFQVDNSQSFEMDLESEKDSTGQSKTLEFERIRSPSGEKIIVRGGRVKIKTSAQTSEKITKKDTLQVNNTSVRTSENTQKITENKSFKKQKEVKTSPFRWLWLTMLISGIIILVLVFLQWRYKLFRWFPTIITKFKKYLNRI